MGDSLASFGQALSGQTGWDFLGWTMMLVPLIGITLFMRRQDRRFASFLQEADIDVQKALFQLAHSRGRVVCFLWGLLTLTIILYDLRYPTNAEPTPMPLGEISPAADAAMPLPEPTPQDEALQASAREIAIDRIKTYYEDAYVSYYYLHKCGAASEADNARLYQALLSDLQAHNAVENADEITMAARGSFEEIYSQTACDAEFLSPVQTRFAGFMDALAQRKQLSGNY